MRHPNKKLRQLRHKLRQNRMIPESTKIVAADRYGQPIYEDSEGHRISSENKITIDIGEKDPLTLVQPLDPKFPVYRLMPGCNGDRYRVTYPPVQRQPTEHGKPIGFHVSEQAVIASLPKD